MIRFDAKGVGFRHRRDGVPQAQIDMRLGAFLQQHSGDVARRTVAKQLAQRLFVERDLMAFDQRDEIMLRVTLQRRSAKMPIIGIKPVRSDVQIGEVAASATGNKDFLSRPIGVIEQQHAPSPPARGDGAHQPGGAGAENDDVEIFHHAVCSSRDWPRAPFASFSRGALGAPPAGVAIQAGEALAPLLFRGMADTLAGRSHVARRGRMVPRKGMP